MNTWQIYPTLSAPMPFQMALDETLFRARQESHQAGEAVCENPIFRFYFSSEPWRSIGYSHRLNFEEQARKEKIPVCRRITGGGIVSHGADLIFSLIARKSQDESFKSVRASYWKIHEAVKKGFEDLGQSVRFYRCDESLPRGKDCFLFPIATDLALGGEKIAGGAEKRSAGVLLHQESVKIPAGISAADLMRALRGGFESVFSIRFEEKDLDPELLESSSRSVPASYLKAG